MRSIIHFDISLEDSVYIASGTNAPIVTEGSTFEDLQVNIRDAMLLYFADDDLPSSEEALTKATYDIQAQRSGRYVLTDDERIAVEEGLAEASRGDVASGAEVKGFWDRLTA